MSVRSIFTNIASMLGGAIEHVSPGFGVSMKKLNTNWSEVDFHTAYNIWLEDYLLQGRYISHFYDYPQPRIEVVSDPESQRPISPDGMCGAKSRDYILSPEIDAEKWASKFVTRRSHNNLFGWADGGKTPVAYGGWVPAYSNTIDKEMMCNKNVPDDVRRPILKGVAKDKEQDRASAIGNVLYGIEHGYDDAQMQRIIDTGKIRYSTREDFKKFFPDGDSGEVHIMPRVIYVENPQGVTFPETYGARSLTILLNPEYDVNKWGTRLVRWWDHSVIVGYSNGKRTSISGTSRPHSPGSSRDRDTHKMAYALEWYVKTHCNSEAATLENPTMRMFVDFNKGDSWAFDSFLYTESEFYRFREKNPAEYLSTLGTATATFLTNNTAVITGAGFGSKVPLPLITLTATTPTGQNLAGNSYTIDSVKPGGEWEPATVTFKA
jgi:hypothetical protein